MKQIIKRCSALLCAAVLIVFSGCSARTPITADAFTKEAKAQGYTVTDSSSSATGVDKYLDAVKSQTQTELVFISFKTSSSAEDAYNSIKKSISQGANAKSSTLDSATYNKYTVSVGELSYTLIRMDTTIFYGKATSSHQTEVDDFVKAIKY